MSFREMSLYILSKLFFWQRLDTHTTKIDLQQNRLTRKLASGVPFNWEFTPKFGIFRPRLTLCDINNLALEFCTPAGGAGCNDAIYCANTILFYVYSIGTYFLYPRKWKVISKLTLFWFYCIVCGFMFDNQMKIKLFFTDISTKKNFRKFRL